MFFFPTPFYIFSHPPYFLFINLTPYVPLSTLGEGEKEIQGGGFAPS
jgi:hypothetical protein